MQVYFCGYAKGLESHGPDQSFSFAKTCGFPGVGSVLASGHHVYFGRQPFLCLAAKFARGYLSHRESRKQSGSRNPGTRAITQ